jgi:hypothetical protein
MAMESTRQWCWSCLAVAALAGVSTGCTSSQPSARPEIDAISKEDHYGTATKRLLYEFRAIVRKHGVNGAKRELPIVLENFDGYEQQALGQHAATYKEIVEKLKALEGTLGAASREAAIAAADEIGALADKLPGTADPNPMVE